MSAAVGSGQRLGVALGLVVDGAGADGVDVAPVRLRLGVDERVAVHLAGRGEEVSRPFGSGQVEGASGSRRSHLQRFDGASEIVGRTGRTGEVENGGEWTLELQVPGRVVL